MLAQIALFGKYIAEFDADVQNKKGNGDRYPFVI